MSLLAFTNAQILDCTGAEPYEGTVIVENDRIKEVGAAKAPAGARVIDCQGKTLMPGLIDGHVHLGSVDAGIAEQMRTNYVSVTVIKTVEKIKESLDQGFTTVRDAGGADPGFRTATETGLIPGPRISISSRILSQTGGHADWRLATETYPAVEHAAGFCSGVYDGVTAVRRASREQLRQGADFIKIMAGGGAMSPADEIDTAQYSLEELKAIVFEAENAGTYVAAHCYSDRSIINCVTSGCRSIEHGNLMTDKAAKVIKEADAFLVPTMVTYHKISQLGSQFGVPENNIRKINEALEKAFQGLENAYKAGCRIGSGSDLLGPMQCYKGGEIELQAEVMGAMDALIATTRTNAELVKMDQDLGTIEAGKLADLIVVAVDPLQNPGVFNDYREKIPVIVKGGQVYKNIL